MINEKIFLKKNIIYIYGIIDFSDITFILYKYNNFTLSGKKFFIVNLKFLQVSNTSILLLMINFIKLSIKRDQCIKFIYVPKFLIELSRVYNLNNILYNFYFRGYHVKRKN